MSSGQAKDRAWKTKEQAAEYQYARAKEAEQLKAIRDELAKKQTTDQPEPDRDFEGGFGGQEELEDRYATTSGEH